MHRRVLCVMDPTVSREGLGSQATVSPDTTPARACGVVCCNCIGGACTGQASLFTLSSSNAVVQMLGKSGPRVVSASIDSKRDLEQQLKSHCEQYIMALTKSAVEPMLGFITKVTAVRLAAGSNKELAKPLREQVRACWVWCACWSAVLIRRGGGVTGQPVLEGRCLLGVPAGCACWGCAVWEGAGQPVPEGEGEQSMLTAMARRVCMCLPVEVCCCRAGRQATYCPTLLRPPPPCRPAVQHAFSVCGCHKKTRPYRRANKGLNGQTRFTKLLYPFFFAAALSTGLWRPCQASRAGVGRQHRHDGAPAADRGQDAAVPAKPCHARHPVPAHQEQHRRGSRPDRAAVGIGVQS